MTWPIAFFLTQLFEMPIYWWGQQGTDRSALERLGVAFGPSALTHPILWFVLHPWLSPYGYVLFFVIGEGCVFVAEGLYVRAFGVRRPWRLALMANGFSAGVGLILQAFV